MKKYWSGTESYFVSAHWLAWLSGALRLWDIITPPLSDGPPHNPLCLHCISEALSIPHPSADSLNLISWCNLMEHADVNTKAFWCAPAEAYPGVVKKWNKSAHNPFSAIVLGADWPLAKKKKDSSAEFCLVRISDSFQFLWNTMLWNFLSRCWFTACVSVFLPLSFLSVSNQVSLIFQGVLSDGSAAMRWLWFPCRVERWAQSAHTRRPHCLFAARRSGRRWRVAQTIQVKLVKLPQPNRGRGRLEQSQLWLIE